MSDQIPPIKPVEIPEEQNKTVNISPLADYNALFHKGSELRGEAPPIKYLIDGFLPQNIVGMVASQGGVGKSWLLMQIGVSIASGYKFMGMATGDPQKVLYLVGEEDFDEIHRRYRLILDNYSRSEGGAFTDQHENLVDDNFVFAPMNGVDARLEREQDEGFYRFLQLKFETEKPGLLIFDPISRFFKGEENKNEDATAFITLLETFKKMGITVIFSHHTSKPGGRSSNITQHDSRGASAFVDGARWQFQLRTFTAKKHINSGKSDCERYGIDEDEYWKHLHARITKTNLKINEDYREFFLKRTEEGTFFKTELEEIGSEKSTNSQGLE